MILKASQRAGAKALAAHLLRTDENEHVEVHELRGFVSDNLTGALREAQAMAEGTRCKQFMFSLSLNPPQNADATDRDFRHAIKMVERELGLVGQPRAIVFHEKEGRRHAHCVWSRINTDQMKAINLPHFKRKLREISRELYIKHEWRMPEGLVDQQQRNPLNFTRAEWQQAKRAGFDPRTLKELLQSAWAQSDSRAAFASAIEERGFWLARGDRRGSVVVDYKGEVYSLSRYVGAKPKDLAAKLGDPNKLHSIEETKRHISGTMTRALRDHIAAIQVELAVQKSAFQKDRSAMVSRHRQERKALSERQQQRWTLEEKARVVRLRTGLMGLWDRLLGRYGKLKKQNERETYQAWQRDQKEKSDLIRSQREERQRLQKSIVEARKRHDEERLGLYSDIAAYSRLPANQRLNPKEQFNTQRRDGKSQSHQQDRSTAELHINNRRGRGRSRRRDM